MEIPIAKYVKITSGVAGESGGAVAASGGGDTPVVCPQVTLTGTKGIGNPVSIVPLPGMTYTGVQWYRNGVAIAGAAGTANPYIQQAADIPPDGGANVLLYPLLSGVQFTTATYTNVAGPVDPTAALWRFASPYNRIAGTSVTTGAGKQTAVTTAELLTIGSGPFKSLCVRFENLIWGISTIIGPGNIASFTEGYIVCNGVSKRITFDGVNTADFADGAYDIRCDKVYPVDFGLTEFTNNTPAAVRWTVVSPVGGKMPFKAYCDTGNRGFFYDPAVTTITNLSAPLTTASISTSGVAPAASFGGACQLLGEFVSGDSRTVARLGDSFEERGPKTSATLDAALRLPLIAGCQIGHSGSEPTLVTANAAIAGSLLKYANVVHDEFGANSVNLNRTLAVLQQNALDTWALIRASQSTNPNATPVKIFRPRLLTVTSGTFTTVAGQTTSARWGQGELADRFWTWLQTQVAQPLGVTMAYDPWVGVGGSVRGSTDIANADYYKFGANMTGDGTHILAAAAVIAGATTRPAWDAIPQ